MFGLGFPELILILVIALVIFGPGKLPEVGQALGRGVKEFKKATDNVKDGIREEIKSDVENKDLTEQTASGPALN